MADLSIEAVVKATIQTQIVAALTSGPDLIEKLVAAALEKPVNPANGQSDTYGRGVAYLDFLVADLIRNAAGEAARELIQQQSERIKVAIAAKLDATGLEKAMGEAFTKIAGEEWRINVTFEREKTRY